MSNKAMIQLISKFSNEFLSFSFGFIENCNCNRYVRSNSFQLGPLDLFVQKDGIKFMSGVIWIVVSRSFSVHKLRNGVMDNFLGSV